jgi:hypothetical protein
MYVYVRAHFSHFKTIGLIYHELGLISGPPPLIAPLEISEKTEITEITEIKIKKAKKSTDDGNLTKKQNEAIAQLSISLSSLAKVYIFKFIYVVVVSCI